MYHTTHFINVKIFFSIIVVKTVIQTKWLLRIALPHTVVGTAAVDSDKAAADSDRVVAETNRAAADSDRAAADSDRVAADLDRVVVDSDRAAADSDSVDLDMVAEFAAGSRVEVVHCRAQVVLADP
ncbi:hypothetical protein ElyMa_004462600 [Elysia marginata]|uniref:Secreted protein n=1 Tax=Elysia marginata TaxID=1093978 RepID=A0AAV4HFE5_9GAST|nr:hypothetical protein ElyMa_004462600 [Elysia marginata]